MIKHLLYEASRVDFAIKANDDINNLGFEITYTETGEPYNFSNYQVGSLKMFIYDYNYGTLLHTVQESVTQPTLTITGTENNIINWNYPIQTLMEDLTELGEYYYEIYYFDTAFDQGNTILQFGYLKLV